jgi:hypothetical protein
MREGLRAHVGLRVAAGILGVLPRCLSLTGNISPEGGPASLGARPHRDNGGARLPAARETSDRFRRPARPGPRPRRRGVWTPLR